MSTRRRVAIVLACLAMLLTGCGTPTAERAGADVTGSAEIYDFTATTVDGDRLLGETLAGRPAVLWFWAPWCPTCRAQVGGIDALAAAYGDRVGIVSVGGLDQAAPIREFADLVDADIVHLLDDEGAVWRHFGVTAQSTYIVLDSDGQVVAEGYLDDADLASTVAELVG